MDIAKPYDQLVPDELLSFDYSRLSEDLEAAKTKCLTEINRVVGAIRDYVDDNGISNQSVGILNEWIARQSAPSTLFSGNLGTESTIGKYIPDLNKEPNNPINSDDNLSEYSATMDDIQTSGSFDGRFIVPLRETTDIATDGVESSGVVGAAGAVMAAGAALGGKIYYDKKKEFNQESNSEKLEEIKSDADQIASHVDGGQFKVNLFNFDGGAE